MFDIYNALNGNAVVAVNNTYGTTGATWLVPQRILPARLIKFGVQVNFLAPHDEQAPAADPLPVC